MMDQLTFECDCENFEKNWPKVKHFIENNINRYKGGISREGFAGIIGQAISYAEGAMSKDGILKSDYANAHDYAVAIITERLGSHSDMSQNTAAGRFKTMISDSTTRCYIYCWIIRNFNS